MGKKGVIVGVALMILSIFVQMFMFPTIWALGGIYKSFTLIHLTTYATTGLFFAGWSSVGAALKPGGSVRRGLMIAVILYLAIGVIYFIVRFKILTHPEVLQVIIKNNPTMFLYPVLWPLNVFEELRPLLFSLT